MDIVLAFEILRRHHHVLNVTALWKVRKVPSTGARCKLRLSTTLNTHILRPAHFEPSEYNKTTQRRIIFVQHRSIMSGLDHVKKPLGTQLNHDINTQETIALFKQTCFSIIYSLPGKYPKGIQLDGTWRPVHHKSCAAPNSTDKSQDIFKATLYGKRSSHGGQSTRGGFRDPMTPTTARIQVPIPNPSITTLCSYVEKFLEGQIEVGTTGGCIQTKKFQVDTHLTVYFEWTKEVGDGSVNGA